MYICTYSICHVMYCYTVSYIILYDLFAVGKISHAAVGCIALVMALSAALGGLTSTIVSAVVQVALICIRVTRININISRLLGLSLLCSNYSFRKFFLNLPIILKIIPTFSQIFPQKAALFSKTHANILIKHKQLYLVTNKYRE